jgi:flagellar FliJ protein
MASSATLHTLIELAVERKNKAAQDFARSAAAHKHACERQVLIESYRADYELRMRTQAGTGIDGTRVSNYSRFIQQLSEAVEQQRLEVDRCARLLQQTRDAFFEEERKVKSFEILAKRETDRKSSSEAKKIQKQIDEFASRKAYSTASGFSL